MTGEGKKARLGERGREGGQRGRKQSKREGYKEKKEGVEERHGKGERDMEGGMCGCGGEGGRKKGKEGEVAET